MRILVLGLGNALMSDDAFGGRVATELTRRYLFPVEVEVIDGGTLGLDLLPRLEGVDRLLVVDALDMGMAAGTLFRLEGEEVPRAFAGKLSVHQMGLQDLLAVAELTGHLPPVLVVLGVQAGSVALGLAMTPQVEAAVETTCREVCRELRSWGVTVAEAA